MSTNRRDFLKLAGAAAAAITSAAAHTPEFLLLPLLNSMTNMTSLSSVPVLLVWLAP